MKTKKTTLQLFMIGFLVNLLVIAAAQGPGKISYQAVIRDGNGQLAANQTIGMQISIITGIDTGDNIYVEVHEALSNANGLISIEIGGGTPVFGSFSDIDWSNGPYFIKNETDPSGGTAYSIAGISEILSVPFALHARTAGSLNGQITESQISNLQNYLTGESDPVFSTSPAQTINGGSIANWNTSFGWGNHALGGYVPATRTLSINGQAMDLAADRSWNTGTLTSIATNNGITGGPLSTTGAIGLGGQILALHNLSQTGFIAMGSRGSIFARSIGAGNGIIVADGDGVKGNPVISAQTWEIGDFAHGGIVFWLDDTGRHGLVCAKDDATSEGLRWHAGTFGTTQAKGDGPLAGRQNTAIIIAAHAKIGDDGSTYAARFCNELKINEQGITYADWFLPSNYELGLMFLNRAKINATARANGGGDFAATVYWSSTETSPTSAYGRHFQTGFYNYYVKTVLLPIRPIRAF